MKTCILVGMIVYRYLFWEYFKVLLLTVLSLVAVLFATRLELIATFSSLGASGQTILKFSLYQLAYILPIVVPIASLLSSILLFQRLSKHQEITALRGGGLSFTTILFPILYSAALLSVLNFYLVSEVATQSHLSLRLLEYQLQSIDPKTLLKSKFLSSQRKFAIAFDESHKSDGINFFSLAHWDPSNQRLQLLLVDHFYLDDALFHLDGMSLFRPIINQKGRDGMFIESSSNGTLTTNDLSILFQPRSWELKNDYLSFRLLIAHTIDEYHTLHLARNGEGTPQEITYYQKKFHQSLSEIFRRLSLALAPFSFTFLGASFGIQTRRVSSLKGISVVIFLVTLYLLLFFLAKQVNESFPAAAFCYLFPHFLILSLSIASLSIVSKGKEWL